MIIKISKVRSARAEAAATLCDYLIHGKKGQNVKPSTRVKDFFVGNCGEGATLPSEAVTEIILNGRRSDTDGAKFMHMVHSLAPGEHLSREQWKEVVTETLKKMHKNGEDMTTHPWLAVIHKDSDHEHMHLVVSTVNPETTHILSIGHSKLKCVELAEKLNKKFNLKDDWSERYEQERKNGKADLSEKENKRERKEAEAIAKHRGERSLIGYVTSFKEELKAAESWEQFLKTLQGHGVELKRRKGGLIFMTTDGEKAAKASAVDRSFSKAHLIERFGLPPKIKDADSEAPAPKTVADLKTDLSQAQTWAQFMRILQLHQMQICKKGQGYIFLGADGKQIKASAVDRSLSKANLEKRFGDAPDIPLLSELLQQQNGQAPDLRLLPEPGAQGDQARAWNRSRSSEEKIDFWLRKIRERGDEITAKQNALFTSSHCQMKTVFDMLKIARERGWKNIEITGTADFKRMAMLAAKRLGISNLKFPGDPQAQARYETTKIPNTRAQPMPIIPSAPGVRFAPPAAKELAAQLMRATAQAQALAQARRAAAEAAARQAEARQAHEYRLRMERRMAAAQEYAADQNDQWRPQHEHDNSNNYSRSSSSDSYNGYNNGRESDQQPQQHSGERKGRTGRLR